MARLPIVGAAAAALLVSVSPASAQSPPGSLGGGFIEFLATGRSRPAASAHIPNPYRAAQPAPPPFASPRQRFHDPAHRAPGADLPMPMPARQAALAPVAPQSSPIKREIDPQFHRQVISYDGPHKPGTIIIDARQRFLFLVESGGTAVRYGIGVGRPGFGWSGRKSVSMKREWPDWRPPPEMLKRRPDLPRHLAGGEDNPLGARALYLGSSLYRIHGTNEPHTIGQAVSSGCFRMLNADVIDLYNRVRVGAPVIVM